MNRCRAAFPLVAAGVAHFSVALAQNSVYLEELTWTEVRDAIQAGTTTVIVPTGGTEQNGPHMALGKHNVIVRYTAGEIAKRLGSALVAPVIAYVPEGNVDPPSGHMRMAGTITLPNEHYMKVLEWAARSLKAHGFTDILLIGDSGGNQNGQKAVAELLNAEWAGAGTGVRVHHIPDYYCANGNVEWLQSQGERQEDIGSHAGINDTSQLWALDATLVRPEKFAPNGGYQGSGVNGNPRRASAEYGRKLLELKIEAGVRQARALMESR
ncbi:MAG: creatininase family protein [Gemmatimonadetes bacterium]|nr:creatininase family protein [Gemmatimonadota bacterium]